MKAVRLVEIGRPLQEMEVAVSDLASTDVRIRVQACGICHSDAHYRAGISPMKSLPVTPGHEVAGRVEAIGAKVKHVSPGDRVCVHYLVSCGSCEFCLRGHEQFCRSVEMIGKHRDGDYAEFIIVPARNAFSLPDQIPFHDGAIMMCSSATALHALRKTRLQPGESLAIFGFGGLGFSALQLARALGGDEVYVVDINPAKLAMAAGMGAVPIDATVGDPVTQIFEASNGNGANVSIDFVGAASSMNQAVRCLGVFGRAAMVALTIQPLSIIPYTELVNKEVEIIGVSDHLSTEIPELIEFAREGSLRFPEEALRLVDLDAAMINGALDALEKSTNHIRTVIVPKGAAA